jgi:hypothetical protein
MADNPSSTRGLTTARPDPMLERIETFVRIRGGGVVVRRAFQGYSPPK